MAGKTPKKKATKRQPKKSPFGISLYEMEVFLDTVMGSLRIQEGGALFKWNAKVREQIAHGVYERMNLAGILVDIDKDKMPKAIAEGERIVAAKAEPKPVEEQVEAVKDMPNVVEEKPAVSTPSAR
jgi:hypothetical protein